MESLATNKNCINLKYKALHFTTQMIQIISVNFQLRAVDFVVSKLLQLSWTNRSELELLDLKTESKNETSQPIAALPNVALRVFLRAPNHR